MIRRHSIVVFNPVLTVISPDPIFTADKRKLYKVIEVWSVDKR